MSELFHEEIFLVATYLYLPIEIQISQSRIGIDLRYIPTLNRSLCVFCSD